MASRSLVGAKILRNVVRETHILIKMIQGRREIRFLSKNNCVTDKVSSRKETTQAVIVLTNYRYVSECLAHVAR